MDNKAELAFDQVIRKIEPLTRFDRTSLKREPDRIRVVTGKAFWRFTPNIFIKNEEHTGRLPYHATQTRNLEKLNEAAQQTLQSAQDALSRRIQAWLQVNERTDAKLEPTNCFDGPKTFGYEHECKDCGGKGWVLCSTCPTEHKGYIECNKCPDKHKGRIDCSKCKNFWGTSTGWVDCKGCGGSGTKSGQKCPTCGGQKRFTCSKCGGTKTIMCDKCNGAGVIPCPTCDTTGRVPCVPCKSTGWLHVLRIVECTVPDTFKVDLRDEKPEVVRQLVNRNLVDLRRLADVKQMPPNVQDDVVKREYEFECAITELRLQVAEKSRELIGFGSKAQIFDYKAIISDLLQSDLDSLQQEAPQTPYRLWGNPPKLLNATRQFLASEVNVQIENTKWIDENIVTKTYADQAKTSLRSALEKLFLTRIGLALLVSVLLPTVIFLICHFTGLREKMGAWVFVAPVIAAVSAWVLLERNARQRLMMAFDENSNKSVDSLLQKYQILWKARCAALALTILLIVLVAILPLP